MNELTLDHWLLIFICFGWIPAIGMIVLIDGITELIEWIQERKDETYIE